jgi:DKNYY family
MKPRITTACLVWLTLLASPLAAWKHVELDSPRYVQCGSTICVVGFAESWSWKMPSILGSGTSWVDVKIPLKRVNPGKFRVLADGWATDETNVWCGRPAPITTAKGVRALGGTYYEVDGSVWKGCRPIFIDSTAPAQGVASASFHDLGCGIVRIGAGLFREGRKIDSGRRNGHHQLAPVPIADGATFVVDPWVTAVDKTPGKPCIAHDARYEFAVREGYLIFTGSRAGSDSRVTDLGCYYARVGDAIYLQERLIAGADAPTFQLLRTNHCILAIARDKNHVYEGGVPRPEIDAPTFEMLEDFIARDRSHVYFLMHAVTGADPATFRILRPRRKCRQDFSGFSLDQAHVYLNMMLLPGADPRTFELVEPELDAKGECVRTGVYSRDAHHVWNGNVEVEGADPATFVVGPNGRARDKNRSY